MTIHYAQAEDALFYTQQEHEIDCPICWFDRELTFAYDEFGYDLPEGLSDGLNWLLGERWDTPEEWDSWVFHHHVSDDEAQRHADGAEFIAVWRGTASAPPTRPRVNEYLDGKDQSRTPAVCPNQSTHVDGRGDPLLEAVNDAIVLNGLTTTEITRALTALRRCPMCLTVKLEDADQPPGLPARFTTYWCPCCRNHYFITTGRLRGGPAPGSTPTPHDQLISLISSISEGIDVTPLTTWTIE